MLLFDLYASHQFDTPVPIVEFLHHMPPSMKEVHLGLQGKVLFDIPCQYELFMRSVVVPTYSLLYFLVPFIVLLTSPM